MNPCLFSIITITVLLIGCVTQQVSYQDDVEPIIQNKCIKCHVSPDGIGYKSTGLEMDSFDNLMQGTFYGPIIVAGDSQRSILNMLVEGRAGKQQRMPHNKDGLEEEEIRILKDWVDQGALNN